jgi:hypothetical protein
MATYTQIGSTVTVGSGGSLSVTFSSIPQTYTDLKIVASARSSQSGQWGEGNITFNGDTTASYSWRGLYGTGSVTGSNNNGAATSALGGRPNGATTTSNTFGSSEVYIPNYTSSNYKSISTDEVTENNGTSALATMVANLWSKTNAITSITITSAGSNPFQEFSTFYLYGIKKD